MLRVRHRRVGCGRLQLHRADVNQPILRSWITALVGGEGVGGHAARANGGRAGQGRHRLRWPAVVAERSEVGNRLDEVRAAKGYVVLTVDIRAAISSDNRIGYRQCALIVVVNAAAGSSRAIS